MIFPSRPPKLYLLEEGVYCVLDYDRKRRLYKVSFSDGTSEQYLEMTAEQLNELGQRENNGRWQERSAAVAAIGKTKGYGHGTDPTH